MVSAFLYLGPQIPSTETYRHHRFETPLRIFTAGGELIGEFGNWRLMPIAIKEVPKPFIDTPLSIWIDFMRDALADEPVVESPIPDSVAGIGVEQNTGRIAAPDDPDAIFEYFFTDNLPEKSTTLGAVANVPLLSEAIFWRPVPSDTENQERAARYFLFE